MLFTDLPTVQPVLIEPHKSQRKIRTLIAADLDYPEDLVNSQPLMLQAGWDIFDRLTDCNLGIVSNDIDGDSWLGKITIPFVANGLAVRAGLHPRIYSLRDSQVLREYADRLIDSLDAAGRML